MFRLFEGWVKTTAVPTAAEPPPGLVAFYWHFVRQTKGVFVALFAAGFVVALLNVTVPVFIGELVTLITNTPREQLIAKGWPMFAAMLALFLVVKPIAFARRRNNSTLDTDSPRGAMAGWLTWR